MRDDLSNTGSERKGGEGIHKKKKKGKVETKDDFVKKEREGELEKRKTSDQEDRVSTDNLSLHVTPETQLAPYTSIYFIHNIPPG